MINNKIKESTRKFLNRDIFNNDDLKDISKKFNLLMDLFDENYTTLSYYTGVSKLKLFLIEEGFLETITTSDLKILSDYFQFNLLSPKMNY